MASFTRGSGQSFWFGDVMHNYATHMRYTMNVYNVVKVRNF